MGLAPEFEKLALLPRRNVLPSNNLEFTRDIQVHTSISASAVLTSPARLGKSESRSRLVCSVNKQLPARVRIDVCSSNSSLVRGMIDGIRSGICEIGT